MFFDPEIFYYYYYYFNLVLRIFVIVVCLSPLAIGFVIRRKWRLAMARQEEIRRLLVLAAEEAARAELEAMFPVVLPPFPQPPPGPFQCAVCYSPTTTRCARCKSVRYCSGKCQIIHWRRGHKEDCHSPSATFRIIDDGINPNSKAANSQGTHSDTEDSQLVKPVEKVHIESTNSNDTHVSEFLSEKDVVTCISDSKEANPTTRGSSDDASISEINDSCDPVLLDQYQSADTYGTSTSLNPKRLKPLSHKSNHIKPGCGYGQTKNGSTSSGLSSKKPKCSIEVPETASDDFCEGALGSKWSKKDADAALAQLICREAEASKLSDSRSSLSFSFNLSGHTALHLHPQGSGNISNASNDSHLASLRKNKVTNGDALSKNINREDRKVKSAQSYSSQRSNHIKDDTVTESHTLGLKDINSSSTASVAPLPCKRDQQSTSTDALKATAISSLMAKSSNPIINGTSTSQYLKSKEPQTLSSNAVDGRLPSSMLNTLVQNLKTGEGAHSTRCVSSQNATTSSNASNGLKTSVKKVVDQFKVSSSSKDDSFGVGSEAVRRYSEKGLFPYDVFIKLCTWNKVELLPSGLTNCGNSCFANVVFQCLAFTQPLNAYLLQGFHSKACVKREWCFTCEFESLILKVREGNTPLSPSGILSELGNSGSHLGNGREEDAHEFLRYIIDKMQAVCLKEVGTNVSASMIEETTLIGLTFGGYLRSKIKCMKCQGKSECQERIMDLTVEIEGDIGTLEEALQKFTSTEMLDGENKYHCSRCKSYEKAKKKLNILEAPNVLTIALKRFQSGKFGKLNKSIEFPEILDLAKYMSGTSDKSPIYKLYGVIVHLDIMNAAFSGHYVCYVKNNHNKWFKIDDSKVNPVELKKVKEKGAYMLFYARYSPRAPKLLRSTISRDTKIKVAMAKSEFPSNIVQTHHSSVPSSNTAVPASSESIYSGLPMQTIFAADSLSDSSSLFSSNSDEGSSTTTESIRDSMSTDDLLSDYIFGPSRNSCDSDTSSSSSTSTSSSPLNGRHSPLADLDRYASSIPEKSGARISTLEGNHYKGSSEFLNSDIIMSKQHFRKLASSSCRGSDPERLGRTNQFENVKFSASFRISSKERTS